MAELMDGDRLDIEAGVDRPGLAGVHNDVTGHRPAVDRRRQEGQGQRARGLRRAGDADVAEARVALLVTRGAEGRAVVGNLHDVDARLDGTEAGSVLELLTP